MTATTTPATDLTAGHRTAQALDSAVGAAAPAIGLPARAADRLVGTSLAVAGLGWAAYLALRPYGDEATLDGAEGVASGAWVASHLLGMVALVATAAALALRWWALRVRGGAAGAPGVRPARRAAVAMAVGTLLVLPYYGAETFGLQQVAAEAVSRGDAGLLEVLDGVRYAPLAVGTFSFGLVLVIAAAIWTLRASWLARPAGRRGAMLFGLALATVPVQYFVSPGLRVAHGVFFALGAALLAVEHRWAAAADR